MSTTLTALQKQRTDTATNWSSANPTLLLGEIGYESDTGKFKIGDGSTTWTSLAYRPGSQISTYPIVNADIAAAAEIAVSKLADGSARQLLQTDAAGSGVEWASNIDIPGTLDVTGTVTLDGNLVVKGTTTEVSSVDISTKDRNIHLAKVAAGSFTGNCAASAATITNVSDTTNLAPGVVVAISSGGGSVTLGTAKVLTVDSTTQVTLDINFGGSSSATGVTFSAGGPTNVTANTGGLTLEAGSDTDKTWQWTSSTASWTSSENIDLASGKVLKVAGTQVLSASNYTGTSAVATSITVADESSDTTCFPLFAVSATGNLGAKSGSNLTFNSSTGALAATSFTGAVTGAVTGNADTATALETARTIGGVSFNGTANINLPGVNTAGNQDTSGTATNATHINVADNESTNENNLITFIEDASATGNVGLESDGDFHYNPSTGTVTATIFSGSLSGNATTSTTATNANHVSVADNESTNENDLIPFIENASATGNVGLESDGDFHYNPSTGTVTATIFSGALSGNATTATTATNANHVAVTDNESTNENNLIPFIEDASQTGNVGLESDGDFYYNPSTGRLTATQLAGTLQTAAQTNITSLGTLSGLAITTASTTDPVLKLTDTGVADYEWTFPDTSTIKLGVSTSSTKELKLENAGSGDFNLSLDGSIYIPDGEIVGFGDPSNPDLRMYHDSSHSYISHTGTGNFYIYGNGTDDLVLRADSGKESIKCIHDAEVIIYHNDTPKLATTADGIEVYGVDDTSPGIINIECDRATVDQHLAELRSTWDGNLVARMVVTAGADTSAEDEANIEFYTSDEGTEGKRLRIMSNGYIESKDGVQSGGNSGGFEFVDVDTSCNLALQQAQGGDETYAALQIWKNTTNNLRIDYSGNIKCGTTSNAIGIDTGNNTGINLLGTGRIYIKSNDHSECNIIGGGEAIRFRYGYTDGTAQAHAGDIEVTATNAVAYTSTSDYRLKENQVAISNGITRLKLLKPYRFNFKSEPEKTLDGFFAHEVTPLVPEAITGTKDGTENILYTNNDTIPSGKSIGDVKETVPRYQGIDQSKLVPLLTAALQEAITKIETLETKVAALEAA